MSTMKAIEYRIARNALREDIMPAAPSSRHAERLIAVVAIAGGLLLFGSLAPELVAAALAASLVWGLAA